MNNKGCYYYYQYYYYYYYYYYCICVCVCVCLDCITLRPSAHTVNSFGNCIFVHFSTTNYEILQINNSLSSYVNYYTLKEVVHVCKVVAYDCVDGQAWPLRVK